MENIKAKRFPFILASLTLPSLALDHSGNGWSRSKVCPPALYPASALTLAPSPWQNELKWDSKTTTFSLTSRTYFITIIIQFCFKTDKEESNKLCFMIFAPAPSSSLPHLYITFLHFIKIII